MLSTRSSSDVRRLSVFASVEAAQEAAKAAKETSTAKTILAAKAAEAAAAESRGNCTFVNSGKLRSLGRRAAHHGRRGSVHRVRDDRQ